MLRVFDAFMFNLFPVLLLGRENLKVVYQIVTKMGQLGEKLKPSPPGTADSLRIKHLPKKGKVHAEQRVRDNKPEFPARREGESPLSSVGLDYNSHFTRHQTGQVFPRQPV